MSRPLVPQGYRSLQDFLLRWHSRNAARGCISPRESPVADSARGTRPAPAAWQGIPPRGNRGAFYERSVRSDVKPKSIRTPSEAEFKPISREVRK
jgi:hypothetical protein